MTFSTSRSRLPSRWRSQMAPSASNESSSGSAGSGVPALEEGVRSAIPGVVPAPTTVE
jgi:hypothetical protein